MFFDPDLPRRIGTNDPAVAANSVWFNVVRPIAVGTMLVGAASTMYSMRESLWTSLRGIFTASADAAHEAKTLDPTERDIPPRWVVICTAVLLIPITAIYYYFTHGIGTAIIAAVIMTITGFLLSAIGGYLVGLVGSSNQPLSGLTLAALIIAALVMLTIGVTGLSGVAAVLGVAAVVCVACSVSGSLIQDLKAGHLLGGTPWKMEVVEIISVILLAFFLMGPDYRSASSQSRYRRHRRTGVARAASGIDGATGERNRRRADGLGTARHRRGLRNRTAAVRRAFADAGRGRNVSAVRHQLGHFHRRPDQVDSQRASPSGAAPKRNWCIEEKGTLLASGLIAGEAIVGILLAVVFLTGLPSIATFSFAPAWGGWLSLIGFAAIAYVLIRIPASAD